MEEIFGGDCSRIMRIRDVLSTLRQKPLSGMNAKDQRLQGAHNACDSVIKVLEDMGYGWLLRSRIQYVDDNDNPFKGDAYTVGTPIKTIRPKCDPSQFTGFKIDKPLPP